MSLILQIQYNNSPLHEWYTCILESKTSHMLTYILNIRNDYTQNTHTNSNKSQAALRRALKSRHFLEELHVGTWMSDSVPPHISMLLWTCLTRTSPAALHICESQTLDGPNFPTDSNFYILVIFCSTVSGSGINLFVSDFQIFRIVSN